MTMTDNYAPGGEENEGREWVFVGRPVRGRSCGQCTLCCRLLPVKTLGKGADVRCEHQCSRGCAIYPRRPPECAAFSCRWLIDASTSELRRPDHAGYVIDPMPDTILADGKPLPVVQVWVDRRTPHAHRDPALRRWLDDVGRDFGMLALIRYDSAEGFALFPPSLAADGEWHEIGSADVMTEDEAAPMRRAMLQHALRAEPKEETPKCPSG